MLNAEEEAALTSPPKPHTARAWPVSTRSTLDLDFLEKATAAETAHTLQWVPVSFES